MPDLSHIRTWIFDLDNTLYAPEARLFDQIEARMTEWVMRELRLSRDEADRMRKDYWQRYGTTLGGLMTEHGISAEAYMLEVHDISLHALAPDPVLADLIARLPGRRIVFTNGSAPYAARVLAARGLADSFDAVYGVEHAGYRSKPEEVAFTTIAALDGHAPATAAMFEDTPANLVAPHALGMTTILVAPTRPAGEHIHHHAPDLSAFLSQVHETGFPVAR